MSLKDYKITDDAVQNVYVQSQPDILNGTTQENKAAFDAYPALIKDRFNAVLEILGGNSAASEILIQAIEGLTAGNVQQALAELKGLLDAYIAKIKSTGGAAEVGVSSISGVSGNTVQQAIESIKGIIDSIEAGTLPDGAVTSELIANGAVTAEKLGKDVTGDKIPVSATDNTPISTSLSNKLPVPMEILSETDLNNVNSPGMYFCGAGLTVFNAPPNPMSETACSVLVEKTYALGIKQKLSWYFTGQSYYRTFDGESWHDWVPDATATPPQVRNLTLQTGFKENGDCTFFVTQENTVFFAGGVSGTMQANQDTQIGTIPADAIPTAQRRRPAVTDSGSAYIDIHTDGTVWAHPFAAASQCWFDTSFVAGGGS